MKLTTADFGGKMWTYFDGSTTRSLSPEEFLRLDQWCPKGTILVAENAHLGCVRTEKSLAQVYDADTLQNFYRRASSLGIDIRLFPQSQSPKARAQTGFIEKNDEADAKAIYAYLLQEPSVLRSLKRPSRTFVAERWREAGWSYKDTTNAMLNVARRFDYAIEGDQITTFVLDNLERFAQALPDDASEIFGLLHRKKDGSFYKVGSTNGPQLSKLYTLAALLLNDDGSLRYRPDTNKPPGISWLVRTQIAPSPCHHRGGIARSNVMWHGFRNYAISKMNTRKASANGKVLSHYDFSPEQNQEFRRLRKDYMQAQRKMLSVMKSLLV
jgi:hypothetical protein